MGSSEAAFKDLMSLVTHGQTLCAMSQYLYFWEAVRQNVRFLSGRFVCIDGHCLFPTNDDKSASRLSIKLKKNRGLALCINHADYILKVCIWT